MSRWLARAVMISPSGPTAPDAITDESAGQQGNPGLLSVVSGGCLDVSQQTRGLVSVLAVPQGESFEESLPNLAGQWCRSGWVWSEIETQTFLVRMVQFHALGLPEALAEKLADHLVARDRDGDDRHLCVECRHCRPGLRCAKQFAVLEELQRCDHFATATPRKL
jgi:hypothetical protein